MSQTDKTSIDRDRERAVIGSLVYNPPAVSQQMLIEHRLGEMLMAGTETRELFRVVTNLVREGQRVPISAIFERLSHGARHAVGGYQGLAQMCAPDWLDKQPSLPELSRALKQAAHKRALVTALEVARDMVMADRAGATEALQERLTALKSGVDLDPECRAWIPLRDIVEQKMLPAFVTKDTAKRKRAGVVPTGLTRLDELLDGGAPRSLWVLAADPGAGKTGFMVRSALMQRALGMKVGVMPLEDPADRIFGRPVAERAGLPWHALTSRENLTEQVQLDAHDALKHLYDIGDGIFVTGSGRTSHTEVISRLDELWELTKGELDCVWLDNSNEVRLDYEDHHRHMDDLLLAVREWLHRRKVSGCFLTHLKRDERKRYAMIQQADLAHSAGFCRIGRLVVGLRLTDMADEPAIAVDWVKGNDSRFKTLYLCFSERGAMPIDREARMKSRKKAKADKQAALFGAKGDTENDAA